MCNGPASFPVTPRITTVTLGTWLSCSNANCKPDAVYVNHTTATHGSSSSNNNTAMMRRFFTSVDQLNISGHSTVRPHPNPPPRAARKGGDKNEGRSSRSYSLPCLSGGGLGRGRSKRNQSKCKHAYFIYS